MSALRIIAIVAAVGVTWMVYHVQRRQVWTNYRRWRASPDPPHRATASRVAAVEQTSALLVSAMFFAALSLSVLAMPALGMASVVLGAAMFLTGGVPITRWECRRIRGLASS